MLFNVVLVVSNSKAVSNGGRSKSRSPKSALAAGVVDNDTTPGGFSGKATPPEAGKVAPGRLHGKGYKILEASAKNLFLLSRNQDEALGMAN